MKNKSITEIIVDVKDKSPLINMEEITVDVKDKIQFDRSEVVIEREDKNND